MTSQAWQGKRTHTHKMRVYWEKNDFLQGNRCFDKKYVKHRKTGTFNMDRPFDRFWKFWWMYMGVKALRKHQRHLLRSLLDRIADRTVAFKLFSPCDA